MAEFENFAALDIRVGEIRSASPLEGARVPAYKLTVDFGEELGTRQSSARIADLYQPEDLIGRQVLAVVNFLPKRVAGFLSEVLVLGVYTTQGVVLIKPDRPAKLGDKLG